MSKTFTIISQQTPSMATFAIATLGVVGAIAAGTPTKGVDAAAASPWFGSVTIMVDGDGSTSQRFTGIAKGNSTKLYQQLEQLSFMNRLQVSFIQVMQRHLLLRTLQQKF